jgi:predicted DsbA family dithiol-disulfide isomerase
VRLDRIAPEYEGRVRVVHRAFPLEIYGGGPPDRGVLEQEWWITAIQEPGAAFTPYTNPDWPTTTLPAFEAVYCAAQQDEAAARRLDMRIRRAFFAESVNIGRRDIYPDLAREAGLDVPAFTRLFESDEPRAAVLEEGRLGKEQYRVRGTPTLMLSDGTRLRHPISYPSLRAGKIVSIQPLPCCGGGCDDATRALFEQA